MAADDKKQSQRPEFATVVVLGTPSRVIARIAASVSCLRRSADGRRAMCVPLSPVVCGQPLYTPTS